MFRSFRPGFRPRTLENGEIQYSSALSPDAPRRTEIASDQKHSQNDVLDSFGENSEKIVIDATRTPFLVGSCAQVEELLCALPMVQATNLQTDVDGNLYYEVSTLDDPPTAAAPYDGTTPPPLFATIQASPSQHRLARLGIAVSALRLDVRTTAERTASNPAYWRLESAAYSLIRQLGTMVGRGTGAESPVPGFEGLVNLPGIPFVASGLGLEGDMATAAMNVHTSGNGSGEGLQCFIGPDSLLRKLMLTDTGKSNGSCGFRYNPRTGMAVYHYLGIPFYRADIPVEGSETTLFAANLGRSGLHLVYAYGAPQTFGIAVDEIQVGSTSPQSVYYVHGAFKLNVWEPEALFKITNVSVI